MANNLTGILSIAASGLMQGSGLAANADLAMQVTHFNQNSLVTEIQRILSYNKSEFNSAIQSIPTFMTGRLPAGIIIDGINANNIPASILTQSTRLFPNPQVFVQIFQQAQGYATKSYNFKKTLKQAQNTKFSDLGFQYQNYTDIMTGGITNQFNTDYLPTLGAEFKNLGTMFNIRLLAKLDDPGILIQNLYRQGLGFVGKLEAKVVATAIDLNSVDEFDRTQLIEVLSTITGSDLKTIIETTKFVPYNQSAVTDLSKVLTAENIFSPDAIKAFSPSGTLTDLARKLGNIGGTFESSESLSEFYQNLNVKKFTNLNQMQSLMTPSMVNSLQSSIGVGTGPDSTVTITDLLGSVAGVGYVEDLKEINRILDYLVNQDTDVIALKTALTEINETTTDLTELKQKIESVGGKTSLQSVIDEGNRRLINCAERLRIELLNLNLSGIIPENFTPNNDGVFSFVELLHSIGQSTANLGSRTLLEKLATPNVYGEAIEAAIFEGQNLNNFSAVGIDPKTKLG